MRRRHPGVKMRNPGRTEKRLEDFTVTCNEDAPEVGKLALTYWSLSASSKEAPEALGTTGDLHSGSPSELWMATTFKTASRSRRPPQCAGIALRILFLFLFTVTYGTSRLTLCFAAELRSAAVDTRGPRNLINRGEA